MQGVYWLDISPTQVRIASWSLKNCIFYIGRGVLGRGRIRGLLLYLLDADRVDFSRRTCYASGRIAALALRYPLKYQANRH